MASHLKIRLDETTYYSTLGLSSKASEKEIHKSYVKLARELHPDKSKSDVAAELFKLISHAHSVLMDKEKRVKYDQLLLSKGLLHHSIKETYHRFDLRVEPVTPAKERSARRQRPYEKQPYGFNTDTKSPPKGKVPIFSSFNLKSYQRESFEHKEQTSSSQRRDDGIFTPRPSTPLNAGKDEKAEGKREEDQEEEEELNNSRSKLHKVNFSSTFEDISSSPFIDRDRRHYARTKHEAKKQGRRSTSPIKTVPTTSTNKTGTHEGWESLKSLLEKFRRQDAKQESRTTEGPSSKANESELDISAEKIRRAESQSIKLDDLGQSLPTEKNTFDMSHVSESIPAVKRAKLDIKISEEVPKVDSYKDTQNVAESLYVPVNKPLPRIYKTHHIPLDQYMINSKSLQCELPEMPNFQCNVMNKAEVEYCKELVMIFNEQSNAIKQNLLATLSDRLKADEELHEKLVKVENTANWVSSKDFDFELVARLSELQNRQRVVAQSFADLLKTVYTINEQHR
ncbi:JJJ2 (YJL162C) [Zygosaccharomyces parabailii]|nr:JJJ2 (YJL162C) [Zygosaccharomyces parabailii]CDH16478.1 related to J protein JJJ2 [Zygosaccharomyces bailii ISA1307]